MKLITTAIISLVLALPALRAHAYDEAVVHPAMTRIAFDKAFAKRNFLQQLNLTRDSLIGGATVRNHLARGSFAEDANEGMFGYTPRVRFHFFQAYTQSALDVRLPNCDRVMLLEYNARDWALGTTENLYDMESAKQHFRLAINSPAAEIRENELAATFKNLGHVMHLVEDMAQPQHSRNDFHLTLEDTPAEALRILYERSFSRYERWCKLNMNLATSPGTAATYANYPLVELPRFSDYFKDMEGRGLAEYSNRNFVTEHTNYSDVICPDLKAGVTLPLLSAATPRQETHLVTTLAWNADLTALMPVTTTYVDTVYSYRTVDVYGGTTAVNNNHTFHSYFDYDLGLSNLQRSFSLPSSALASQASFLVPRAVGYAAGILDLFFSGHIDARWKKTGPAVYELTLTNLGDDSFSGSAELYYRVPPGTHGAAPGHDLVRIAPGALSSVSLDAGASATFSGLHVDGLEPSESLLGFERRILLNGSLGSESNHPIGLVQPPDGSLKLEVSTDCAVTSGQGRAEFVLLSANKSGQGDFRVIRLPMSGSQQSVCNTGFEEERLCIDRVATNIGVSASLTVMPYVKDRLYLGGINGVFTAGCTKTTVLHVDGVKKQTRTNTFPNAGEYAANSIFYPVSPCQGDHDPCTDH